MEALELEAKYVKVLIKKAYEWRAKTNKRHNRLNYFKTQHAIKRFRNYLKKPRTEKFRPNKNEIIQILNWFLRCPAHNKTEKLVFTLVGLVYKLHKSKLTNLK